jgi:hypothetical protein
MLICAEDVFPFRAEVRDVQVARGVVIIAEEGWVGEPPAWRLSGITRYASFRFRVGRLACPKLVLSGGLKEMFAPLWGMRGVFVIFVVVPVMGLVLLATGPRWILGEG